MYLGRFRGDRHIYNAMVLLCSFGFRNGVENMNYIYTVILAFWPFQTWGTRFLNHFSASKLLDEPKKGVELGGDR